MLKGEIEILSAIALNKCTVRQIANNKLARSSSYILSTIDSLIRSGYVYKKRSKDYQLTPNGVRAFIEFCSTEDGLSKLAHDKLVLAYKDKAKLAIAMIENLGTEFDNKLEEL